MTVDDATLAGTGPDKLSLVVPQQAPVKWYEDPRLVRGVTQIVVGVLGLVRILFFFKLFKWDVSSIAAEDVVSVLTAIALSATGLWLGIKSAVSRVADGLSPHHSDPPIATGTMTKTVESVERMTGNIPKP